MALVSVGANKRSRKVNRKDEQFRSGWDRHSDKPITVNFHREWHANNMEHNFDLMKLSIYIGEMQLTRFFHKNGL